MQDYDQSHGVQRLAMLDFVAGSEVKRSSSRQQDSFRSWGRLLLSNVIHVATAMLTFRQHT